MIAPKIKNRERRMGSEIGNGYVNPFVVSAEQQVSMKFKCRLYGEYTSSEDFIHTLEVLEQAEENDLVELHICGPGGSLDAVVTLLHAMDKCKCPVHVCATGNLSSAATLPILSASSYELHEYTDFMFHSASFGVAYQKTHDVFDQVVHNKKHCEYILRDAYEFFFTEDELDAMMNGKTFWMDAEEFTARYEKRNELMEAEINKMQESLEAGSSDEKHDKIKQRNVVKLEDIVYPEE